MVAQREREVAEAEEVMPMPVVEERVDWAEPEEIDGEDQPGDVPEWPLGAPLPGATEPAQLPERHRDWDDRFARVRQRLIDDHDCEHRSWKRIRGPRNCEECGDKMPIWLNVCRQCSIMVCRRCRYNRV